jgi:G3E family GTPase
LVDAINFENTPEKEITIKQIVVADLILVSKSEQLSEIQKEMFKENLKIINPFAEIEFTTLTVSDFLAPFGGLGVRELQKHKDLNSILQKPKTKFDFVGISNTHSNLSAKTLKFNQPLKKEEFLNWLSYTLDLYKNEIYRVKGILCFENEPYEFILQGVGASFELVEGDLIMGETKSVLVFIGKLKNVDFSI